MGARLSKKESFADKEGSLTINLFGPGMTALHKVGLAGLWMTLKALEKDQDASARLQKAGGSWDITGTSVTLRWSGKPEAFFKALLKESFKIDKKGLLWFPAFGVPIEHRDHAVVLQESVLGSFLQHGQTRKADPSLKPQGSFTIQVDEKPLVLRYRRIKEYAHQKPDFEVISFNPLAGWQYPGGAVRHVGLGQGSTALQEPPERALALRFAPVGSIYFEVRRLGGGVRLRYALVIPEITDLKKYAHVRKAFVTYGINKFYVGGVAEAGFRVLIELQAAGLLEDIGSASCRVIAFGIAPWSTQQKTRLGLFTVRPGPRASLRIYGLSQQYLSPHLVRLDKKEPFWDVPQVPDLVARNLSEGRRWWEGFSEFVADQVRRKHVFNYEKEGIGKMVADKEAFPEGSERTFVMACHEAWRRRLGQLGERARREGASFHELVRREYERQRVSFARCKNAATLREAVTDLWSRAGGPLPSLQGRWGGLLVLLDEKNWRQSKDLALLALASYKPATKEEEEALGSSETKGKGEAGQ